ncbi:hypothetical protein DQ04_15501000 [Trypanosoma grayi]|uniref:hypothetical protein n=1 Tax=Trypanosoma grayi TaxID=71804 RepID=UPI0004F3F332|nr:hypothetical protein DQ04_15501000 [Trypanosoma grayi]KEG06175.1 hypothetical protein DQ04_15501000 [Trypanosoma grayi]
MHLWHTFMLLEKTVFYTFMRGDLVGRGHTGDAEVSLPGAYLCITHDMVLVMRDNGTIPRWIRLHDVHTFECNTVAKRPFFAFLTDDPSPDILFIPTPPAYGPTAIAAFSGFKAVLSVKAVLQDACFASHGIRRATEFVDANWAASVRAYYTAKEDTRRFKFKPLSGFDDSLSCLIPKVQLAKVWQEVLQEQRSRSSDDVAAIPLGGAGAGGGTLLSSNEISTVRRRMDLVQSRSSSEIVGMPLDRLLGSRRERLATSLETPTIRPDSFAIAHQQQEVVYQQPGTCYLPSDASLMVVQPGHEPHFGPESNVAELVNTSLVAIGAHSETKGYPAAKEGAEPPKQ